MIAKILGRNWRIERTRVAGHWGTCDTPTTNGKAITLDPALKGEKLLEYAIHEALHAANWSLDEEFVETYAKDAARLATRLGFRQAEERI